MFLVIAGKSNLVCFEIGLDMFGICRFKVSANLNYGPGEECTGI